jgi:antitoxin (DNA-binding transcriptional repressor) of toxin-antitoxin stability system
MGVVHISEAELVENIASFIDRARSGTEIVIERNAQPVAVLRSPEPRRRKLSEIMASLSECSAATVDPGFAADVHDFIDRHREPLHPPEWD